MCLMRSQVEGKRENGGEERKWSLVPFCTESIVLLCIETCILEKQQFPSWLCENKVESSLGNGNIIPVFSLEGDRTLAAISVTLEGGVGGNLHGDLFFFSVRGKKISQKWNSTSWLNEKL